jgi:hypothetical protein
MADSIPVCHRPFPLWGSTGSKQTLNGLFYVNPQPLKGLRELISELFSLSKNSERLRDEKFFNL